MSGEEDLLWYADGYHAGLFLRNRESLVHSLAQICHGLRERPTWKVNLEVEGYALEVLAQEEWDLMGQLRELVRLGRVEIISGSYTQPLPWVIDGESTIRNLKVGKEIVRQALGCDVVTYAVQEPCWSSQLPQLLANLGYQWCVLKNHFTYFGRPPKHGKDRVRWVGPDGSGIQTSPTYSACQDRGYNDAGVRGGEEFMRRCRAAGVQHPVGFFIEDIGGAQPSHVEDPPAYIRFALWREYFEATPLATQDWILGQEDFRLALHWGMPALQELARASRALQGEISAAERLSGLASLAAGHPYPEPQLARAWKILMQLQHHDPWLVPEARLGVFSEHPFSWWVQEWQKEGLGICRQVIDAAMSAMVGDDTRPVPAGGARGPRDGEVTSVMVFNPLGAARRDLVHLEVADGEDQEVSIIDDQGGPVPSQRSGDRLAFVADAPGFGSRRYRVLASSKPRQSPKMGAPTSGEVVSLSNPFCELELDGRHGGCLSRLYDRQTGREVLDGSRGYGNDFVGYLGDRDGYVRASERPAAVTLVEKGEVGTCTRVEGTLHTVPFVSQLWLYNHTARIDYRVEFHFGEGTWIGDTYRAAHWTDRRQSWHVDRKKLQVQFPVAWPKTRLCKDAAFEVVESRLEEPFHETWDDVKTNVVLSWVDISDGEAGFALFTDRSTSYGYSRDWPLALILGWGQLAGTRRFEYSTLSHSGTWREAGLPSQSWARDLPLVGRRFSGPADGAGTEGSRLSIEPSWVLLSAVFREGGHWYLRLYNASDRRAAAAVEVPALMGAEGWRTDLMGRPVDPLPMAMAGTRHRFTCQLRPFGIETIRLDAHGGRDMRRDP